MSDVVTWLGAPLLAIWLGADSPVWRDDLSAVRAGGVVLRAGDGLLTTLFTICSSALPLGSHAFRATLVSAVAASFFAVVVRSVAARLLAADGAPAHRVIMLSTIASLLASLSPTLQREATVGGSALVAALLATTSVGLALGRPTSHRAAALGAALGLLAIESPVTFVASLPALGIALFMGRADDAKPSRPAYVYALSFAALAAAALALPPLARALSSTPFIEVSSQTAIGQLLRTDVASLRARGLSAFFGDLGGLALLLAGTGAIVGLKSKRSRALVLPLLALLLVDLLVPPRSSGALASDPFAATRVMAIASAATLSLLGVEVIVAVLTTTGLSFARPAGAMVIAFSLSLVALSADEARAAADRRSRRGAEAFTREAFDSLPHGSVVLVRNETIAYRLSAAHLAGRRPDVLIVPTPLLGRGRLAARLLAEEPALLPLLRDLGALGGPTEHAMSSLADVRPLYAELDPTWDRRLASHAVPEHLFLRFLPQPLAPADRVQGSVDTIAADQRVLDASTSDDLRDPATSQLLAVLARGELDAAIIQGEKVAATRALGRLTRLGHEPPPGDPIWETFGPKKVEGRGTRARAR